MKHHLKDALKVMKTEGTYKSERVITSAQTNLIDTGIKKD